MSSFAVVVILLALAGAALVTSIVAGLRAAWHWKAALRLRVLDPATGDVHWPDRARQHLREKDRWAWRKAWAARVTVVPCALALGLAFLA